MDPEFFDILVCPLCKGELIRSREPHALICKIDKLAFPIEDDGAVVLLAARARPWPEKKPDKKNPK